MASMADLISVSLFAILIPLLSIFGISFAPQTSVEFERVTNNGISGTMVQSLISTLFNEKNNEGIDNYKAISYRLCDSPSARNAVLTEIDDTQPGSISGVLEYMKIKFDNIPSQCSSVSSYTEEDLLGAKDPRARIYTYDQKIPVIGGDVVDMRVRYEVGP